MATDYRDYFNTRLAQEADAAVQAGLSPKYDAVQAASRQKAAELMAIHKERLLAETRQAESWVGQAELDPDGIVGMGVNAVASGYSGTSRLAGHLVSAIPVIASIADESSLTQPEIEAYNRKAQGKATPEDMALLTRPKAFYAERDTPEAKARAQAQADKNPNGLTALQLIERSQKTRTVARNINEAFDASGVVHSGARDELTADLGGNFDDAWKQTGLEHLFDKDKEIGSAKNVIGGLAKLIYNAGDAALTHPGASAEYVIENLPQIALGGSGKVGQLLLSTSNVGYAADNYEQGMQKYAATHNGAFPPPEERQHMAIMAASTMAAEQIGQLGQLKAIGKIRTAADLAEEGAKTGVLKSVGNTVKAGATGLAEEGLTEGYQTYAEGEAQRAPASAKDIYLGGTIGAIAGAGMSAGGRAGAEALGATPEKAAKREVDAEKAKVVDTAIKTGDVSALTDPKNPAYAPAHAIAALYGHTQEPGASEETKQTNLEKASQIVADLQARKDKADEAHAAVSPEAIQQQKDDLATVEAQLAKTDPTDTAQVAKLEQYIKLAKEELASAQDPKEAARIQRNVEKVSRLLEESQQAMANFHQEVQTKNVDVDEAVAKINGLDVKASQAAATSIINLSMAIPERLDSDVATSLAANPDNGLTTPQRAYLRAFSASQKASNLLKDMDKVTQQIFFGGPGFQGITQYRANVASALAAGNRATADQQIAQLDKFVSDHKTKAATLAKAKQQFDATGEAVEVLSDGNRGWYINDGEHLPEAKRRANGGLLIDGSSNKLVNNTQTASDALEKAAAELRAAYEVKFPAKGKGASDVKDVSPAGDKASTEKKSETQAKTEASADKSGGKTPDAPAADVQSSEKPAVAEAAEKTKEAPASSANTDKAEEAKTASTVEGQNQSTEKTTDESAESQSGEITAFQEKSPEGTSYQSRNLVADFFTQSKGSEKDGSLRPLVVVKNFLSQTAQDVTGYLKDKTLSVKQQETLKVFREKAKEWQDKIQANLGTKQKEFRYQDMMTFLSQEKDGKRVLDENIKTAMSYAVFSWLAEQSGREQVNLDDDINAILERPEGTLVSQEERDALSYVGLRQSLVFNTLGQRTLQALGLKSKSGPRNLQPNLEAAVGANVWKLMMDLGMLTQTTITGEQMAELTGSKDTSKTALFHFIKIADNAAVNDVVEAMAGSQNLLDKLFSVESGVTEPTLEPVEFAQKKTRNTDQNVPAALNEPLNKENKAANHLRQDMWQLITQLSDDVRLAIAGVEEVSDTADHLVNRRAKQAKNDGLKREMTRLIDFVTGMADMEAPLFFEHNVWKQQRVGILTNVINPQTSKIHRFMLYRNAWTTKVDRNDDAQMSNFRLRVMEGFGVKTDKQSNATSLAGYEAKVNDPVIADAVEVLREAVFEGGISADGQQTLLAAVRAGGEKFHTLDALMALAHEAQAKKEGKDSFTVQMMGEVDGVTNGPMLSHLMMGAAATVEQLFGMLNRGGFFEVGNADSQYNQWREKAGHLDLYETTALHMTQSVQAMLNRNPKLGVTLSAIYSFTGTLADKDGAVAKAGRNIIKTPLTAMVFGSSVKSAVDSMADNFIASIYSAIEDVSAGKGDVASVINDLNTLLIMGKGPTIKSMSIEQLMKTELTKPQIKALKKAFKETLGKAVEETMQEDFSVFIEKRKTLNQAAEFSFALYDAVYQGLRSAYVDTLAKDGAGKPIHDLTMQQEAEIRKKLQDMVPVLQTLLSQDSKSSKSGLYASKSGRKLSTRSTYQSGVKFATPIKGTKVWSAKQGKYVEAQSVEATAVEQVESAPGVAMGVMGVHATDSAISHLIPNPDESLNVHDARGAGLGNLVSVAKDLNQSTWNAMLAYSLPGEMADMLSRVVVGLASVVQSGSLPPEVMTNLTKALEDFAAKNDMDPATVLGTMLSNVKDMAYSADDMRLQALAQMQAVDQYAMEDGNYQVTDEDRAEAAAKRAGLVQGLTAAEQTAVDQVVEALGKSFTSEVKKSEPKPTAESVFGKVGTPKIQSDADLVAFFEATPETTAGEVIKQLAPQGRLSAANRKILFLLNKLINKDLSIKYVTPDTLPNEVLAKAQVSARGWFVSTVDGQEAVYVLSPDFESSGLTAETLLHELVHAALARVIDKPSAEAAKLVAELDKLRLAAQEYVSQNKLEGFTAQLASVQEFVAWGMTNQELQDKVLKNVTFESTTKGNALVNGWTKFIETLTSLLGGDKLVGNGLEVLIQNVSGLATEAAQKSGKAGSELNLAQEVDTAIDQYTTMDIHRALDNGRLGPAFQAHLASLLGGIVERLHGPFGAFAAQMRKTEAGNPMAVWLKAMETGHAPFASAIVASGFAGSAQEDFAMQQVEATVKAALDGNEAFTKSAYTELSKLYTEMRSKLKLSDFDSQADYDFVFKLDADLGGKSDYLARFAALGLASEKFNSLMKVATEKDSRRFGEGKTLTERLMNIFEKIVAFFNEKITHTYGGQQADVKLTALVEQLVDIEARKRHALKLRATRTNYLEPVETAVKDAADKARAGIAKAAGSDMVRNNKNAFVKAAGGLARTYANDQVEIFMDGLQRLRDSQFKGRLGIVASLVSEVKGPLARFSELLRETKHLEGQRKKIITQHAALALKMFANGRDMTEAAKASISSVMMRTGMHNLLGAFTLGEIEALVGNSAEQNKAIAALEAQLTGVAKHAWIVQAKALGYYKATGLVRSKALMFNAHTIARLFSTQFEKQITEQEARNAEGTLAQLVSLYALKWSTDADQKEAKEIFRTESNRTDGKNGVEFILNLHKQLEADSLERLFDGNPTLMIHGYTPEITNPHTAIKIADDVDGQDLLDQGYSLGAKVGVDAADPDQAGKRVYVMRDGGLAPWLSGVFSLSSMKAKGSKKHNGFVSTNTATGLDNAQMQAQITNAKLKYFGNESRDWDPSLDNTTNMAPVFNGKGQIVNWRYMMAETTKDRLLERDNRFDQVVGALAGSIFDKETSKEQNAKAILALREQFEADYATRRDSYIEVGRNSSDPEMRALWDLLPDSTQQEIRKVWGQDKMMVRNDALDIMFGYRKKSLAEFLRNDADTLDGIQKIMREWFTTLAKSRGMDDREADNLAKRAGLALVKGERAWQEVVHEVKDIIVVKSGFVLLGNIWSNISLLALSGVSMKDSLHHHLVAIKASTAYQRDADRLAELETQMAVGYQGNDKAEAEREIIRLKDAIARNPVKELIDAGLMPTIVEDVAAEDDIYSFKNEFARKTEKWTNRLNPKVKDVARFMYMTHDTEMYQTLSKITQLSDFVARYTLYQHLTTRTKDPMSKADAIQRASDAFVNYDIPMHRGLQYTDDMGFTPFSKYFLRIQRVLLQLTRENPARVLTAVLLNHFMDLGPIVLDSSFVHHIGNDPIRSGAFQFVGVLDELATVHAAMAVVK